MRKIEELESGVGYVIELEKKEENGEREWRSGKREKN